MQTRSQEYSKKIFEQIDTLELPEDKKKAYGSLCHNFPLMVLRSGLSQAVAFVWVKSKGNADSPEAKFLAHLADLSGLSLDPKKFQQDINELDLIPYLRSTRKILAASIWYKRFAESILGVEAGEARPEGDLQNG